MTRLLTLVSTVALLVIASGSAAMASTSIAPDAGWQDFITGGGVDGGTTTGPFAFTTTAITKLTVTDAFCHGDEFHVFDNGELLGDTSEIAPELHTCPFRLFFPAVARADDAIADPTFSHGTFYLAPGAHSLEITNKAMWNDTAQGTGAYFRLDSVVVSKADCKDSGWTQFAGLFDSQGDCVSLVNSIERAS